jgi:tetratricopeptide (TPR) repeat protein
MKLIVNSQEPAILEKEGKLEEAAEGYEEILKDHPLNSRAYDRLIIVYRKLKEYNKELATVERAIKHFEEKFNKEQPAYNKRVATLSKALLKATGLSDKKGNNLYQPGELLRWKKRKDLLIKKLKSSAAKRKKVLKKD